MLVYRIVHQKFSTSLYAAGLAGRWNGSGRKVVYTAESIPLAFMENMIRRKGAGFNQDYRTMVIEIPDDVSMTVVNVGDLQYGWRDFRNYFKCQTVGNDWYDKGQTAVLKVPSAVLPEANNYVINTTHREYRKVVLVETIPLIPDERIEEILKKYPK